MMEKQMVTNGEMVDEIKPMLRALQAECKRLEGLTEDEILAEHLLRCDGDPKLVAQSIETQIQRFRELLSILQQAVIEAS
jgi:hypothetical protein